jgi:hypothetical protein
MEDFRQLLMSERMSPDIQEYLLDSLDQFHKRPMVIREEQVEWKQEMVQIGWMNVFSGFMGIQIIQLQSDYYKQCQS